LAGLMAACDGKDCDTATGEDCDTDTGGECDNEIDSVFPENGELQAYFRTTVEVTLEEPEADATLTLTDSAGNEVPGQLTVDDDTLIFVPDAALAPSTEYNVNVDFSCGMPSTTFTTSEVGSDIDASTLEGNTYSLDIASGRFVEPAGIGSILGDFIDQEILIGVQTADATDIQMIGAIGDGGAQGECDPTIGFPSATFAGNPFFQIGPETTTLSVAGYTVTIEDLEISGAFAPDASYIAGAVLAGTIDTRPLVPLVNAEADCSDGAPRCCDTDIDPNCNPDDDVDGCCDEDYICDLATTLSVSCISCTTDGEDFCLSLYVDSMQAEIIAGTTIDPQHAPADDATAPPESTNICEIPNCAGEEECLAQPQ